MRLFSARNKAAAEGILIFKNSQLRRRNYFEAWLVENLPVFSKYSNSPPDISIVKKSIL